MGQTIKRVALHFCWPQGRVWPGYINPFQPSLCTICQGTGRSHEVQHLYDRWYGRHDARQDTPVQAGEEYQEPWMDHLDEADIAALLEADRLWEFTHTPRTKEQQQLIDHRVQEGHNHWLPFSNGYVPSPEEVNIWSRHGWGHDEINAHYVIIAKAKKLGYPLVCHACSGEGFHWSSFEDQHAYEIWEPTEPPDGEEYQLWETLSACCPLSPVFVSLEELCRWCENHAVTCGRHTASAQEWKKMLSHGRVYHHKDNNIFI